MLLTILMSLFSVNAASSKSTQIALDFRYEILEVSMACVEKFNSESESSGITYFYDKNSLKAVLATQKSGLLSQRLMNGEQCGGDVPLVQVSQYAKAADFEKQILAKGGFKKVKVFIYSYDELKHQLQAKIEEVAATQK